MRRTHLAACAASRPCSWLRRARWQTRRTSTRRGSSSWSPCRGSREHQKALQTIADLNGGTRHTRTPGYTASAAYVKATLEKAGYDAHYEMFNMPEWHETAPAVLQLASPTSKTYMAGTAADDNSPTVDIIAFEHTPTKAVSRREVVADRRHVDPGRAARRAAVSRPIPGRE